MKKSLQTIMLSMKSTMQVFIKFDMNVRIHRHRRIQNFNLVVELSILTRLNNTTPNLYGIKLVEPVRLKNGSFVGQLIKTLLINWWFYGQPAIAANSHITHLTHLTHLFYYTMSKFKKFQFICLYGILFFYL